MLRQVANLWLSSHNFGEEAVIQKFQYKKCHGDVKSHENQKFSHLNGRERVSTAV